MFGECCVDDPWIFRVHHCFLCGIEMPKEVVVKIHPPTAGVGGGSYASMEEGHEASYL